jgi:hypothetical protein
MDMTAYAGSESKYLKAADLNGKSIKVMISSVALVEFDNDGEKETKPCLSLQDKEKKVVCNATSVMTLGNAYGFDSDGWINKEIGLSTKYYEGVGKEGIVITAMSAFTDDDDIPF